MPWCYKQPIFGDHIRVNRRFYYHHGIFIDDNNVISFTSKKGELNPKKAKVIVTTLKEFAKNQQVEVRVFSESELLYKRTPSEIVNYAILNLNRKGYNLFNYNCEHFANECVFGQARSEQILYIKQQLKEIFKRGNNMYIKKATIYDIEKIKHLFIHAINYMNNEKNINQWKKEEITDERNLMNLIERYNVVVDERNNVIGGFTLLYDEEKSYLNIDGKWLNDEKYVTIHKIAVLYNGKGIAKFILNYVIEECKKNNIKNIRIDTHKDNISMHNFLNKNDFIYCGKISLNNNFSDKNSLREAFIKKLEY